MSENLRIMHCLRSPLGGLFRHVSDLAEAQLAHGHQVGVICDADTGGQTADQKLTEMALSLPLGVNRVNMSRKIGPSDVTAYNTIKAHIRDQKIDILHGHGAKGGAYSRLVAWSIKNSGGQISSFYTPHGGSLHYEKSSIKGRIYLKLEKAMMPMTTGIIFESAYSAQAYAEKIGPLNTASRIIPNGLHESEFAPHTPNIDAVEIIFVGELRHLKGVDVLLKALAGIRKKRPVSAHFYGDGPDTNQFIDLAKELGLTEFVDFPGRMPARAAFDTGKLLIVPSRAESFPYIVLEAGACAIPLIVTDVGGIPEIVGPHHDIMVKPGDASELENKIEEYLNNPNKFTEMAKSLQSNIHDQFTVDNMTRKICEFYIQPIIKSH